MVKQPKRDVPRQRRQDWIQSLLQFMNFEAVGLARFAGVRDLIFRGTDCSPQNISAPFPSRRYLARLRYNAQHPGVRR